MITVNGDDSSISNQNSKELSKKENTNNVKTKEIFFMICYRREEEESDQNFVFTKCDKKPENIFTKVKIENGKNDLYFYQKVFKLIIQQRKKEEIKKEGDSIKKDEINKKKEDKKKEDKAKKEEEIEIQFEIGKDNYIISFNVNDNFFYYDIELKKGNKYLTNIAKEVIDQNLLNYYEKFVIFLEALNKIEKKEKGRIDILYEETIKLYSKKKGFYFLIKLFMKIYDRKNLCMKLIKEFYKINEDKKNDKNLYREESLNDLKTDFEKISSEADNIIQKNGYDDIQFYGIILCYLNYYDYDIFNKYLKKLYLNKSKTLFEILLVYDSNILNPIEQNLEFFTKFIEYTISEKEFDYFENLLSFILDIETFIIAIDKTKEKMFEKYKNNFKIIKMKSNGGRALKKRKEGKEIDIIISSINSIIDFSKENNILLIYFTSNFWKDILKQYNQANELYINICFKLRKIFIAYNELVNFLFNDKIGKKEDKKNEPKKIKNDINKYFDIDEFAFILDKNIKNLIVDNKNLSDSEILGFIKQFDPYYIEDKYKFKRETNIFDYLSFSQINKQFIETFKGLKFETVFKEKLTDFMNKMVLKIDNIFKFGVIMDLIDIKKISKVKEYFNLLKHKFDYIVQKELNSLTGEKLNEAVKILAKFVDLLYKNDKDKKTDFLKQKIDKLDKTISPLIYNELMRTCQGEEYKNMKEFIYETYLNKMDNIDNIISLIDSLSKEDKKNFLRELMKKCKFTSEEFYSNNNNTKIILLCELHEKGKLKITDEDNFYGDIEDILGKIRKDMDGDINKQKLEEFLNNGKDVVIKRLSLIKMILEDYDPEKVYYERNENIKEITNDIKQLLSIKNSLLIFHRNNYLKEIKNITNIIEDIQKETITNYKKDKTKNTIASLKNLSQVCDDVNSVKDVLLFKVIYDVASGSDQTKRFNKGIKELKEIIQSLFGKNNCNIKEIYEKNKKIFDKIKDIVSNNESKADLLIEQMINYYIKENKETKDKKKAEEIKEEKKDLINDLIIIFKSKKYEMDLKSIIFFFKSFNPNDTSWNKKLSKEFETLSKEDLQNLKTILKDLQKNKIYDYEQKNNYFKLFTSLYEKKEAIDFLLSKTDIDIKYLYDRIEPTNRTITIKNIEDCEKCIKIFKTFRQKTKNFELFEYIKTELDKDNEQISGLFESYSKNYSSIIELDRNNGFEFNLFENVNNIIDNASLIFKQDNEDFCYGKDKIKTNIEELIHLKNKIHIKSQNNEKETENDQFQIKCKKLIFFKKKISNLEKIYDDMKVLRTKGSSLPILIIIKIVYPKITYSLNKIETNFEEIKNFLFRAKTEQITQLDLIYKQNKYLRFLYGKLFRRIIKHLDGEASIYEIMRYILNKTNNDNIIEGEVANPKIADDYVEQYKLYNDNSFQNISNYITSLFEKNGTSLQKHYEEMIIKSKNRYKGFYLHKCENGESVEEFIINIFLDKIGHLPLAQNVLIFSKETSPEEIQAFFYRSILCDYNTLFVVELNNSFSDFQQNVMYSYIDSILSYKNKVYNESEKQNIDKNKTNIYLKSCIVFVYDENIKDNSFLVQLGKVEIQDINIEKLDNNEKEKELENIIVISSEICGLGKSHKIKKMIEKDKKQYYHFPLGGILTKANIFEKLSILLKIIKKENSDNYESVTIHLDLTESKETSIINEFLFSFLITKFYINNENIIYIPKDIKIYIEIPNCFENYLSKFGIIKIFKNNNISLDNIPKLDLPQDIIKIFQRMLGYKSNKTNKANEEIEAFIKKYIGIDKCSFHQIQIFIKLFISQYNKFETKLCFWNEGKEVTEECIQEFAKATKYFTFGGFAQLLNRSNITNQKDYIDLLSDIYDNDLKNTQFSIPLIFIIKEKKQYIPLKIPDKNESEYKDSKDYLNAIKRALNLPNEVEKDYKDKKSLISILNYKTDNYVITDDNFKKMILLVYRIKANIPVIIMGETGCGKTALITKLNQILNNGEITVKTINIHPGLNDKDICEEMKKINKEAKNIKDEIWVFFDEINTCLSLSLLTEIFINRTYNGEKLNDNIRLIGACNPYRKRKTETEKCGLNRDDDNENELVYLVQPLPQSLLYYVFSFGSINEEDEKKYIYSIIERLFTNNEKKLHEITRDAIFECHKYLRETFDPSVVSLREISRFYKCVEFFQKYFSIKDVYLNVDIKGKENLYKIKSIICSIYLCYYIRLIDDKKRAKFDIKLKETLLNLVNAVEEPENKIGQKDEEQEDKINKKDEKNEEKEGNLFDRINYKELKDDLREQKVSQFSDFLNLEEEFLLNLIELDKGIGKNNLLKENVFLLFLSVITKIPLIIIGKPGTGKSLSAKLIYKSMKGKYSKEKFFREFPQIIQTYFQGSESTNPEDVQKLFQMAETKYKYFSDQKDIQKEDLPISMILFDELGLAEKSETNPLKVLHSKLEYAGKNEGVSFIGISNYSLDAAKINRALILSVPNLEERVDQLINTSKSIVESISEDLLKNQKQVFDILAIAYYQYKQKLKFLKELTVLKMFDLKNKASKNPIDLSQKDFKEINRMKDYINLYKKEKKIKEDFHGNRDLYNFIKEIAIETGRLSTFEDNEVKEIIERYIERNFGGIDYEIDIDFKLELNDIKTQISEVKQILEGYIANKKRGKKPKDKKDKNDKVSSVFLFKKVYNIVCGTENQYKIKDENCKKYDLNRCIVDNINDNNNPRYLLLEIKPSLSSLIHQNIKSQNPDKKVEFYDGSPFIDDNNNEYRFRKVNEIQDDAKTEKLIILQNLNQIQPFLFDLYNMNYIIKDEQKFARICLDNFSEQLTPVNDLFRIIILVDKKFINNVEIAFLNRLEKMKISFDKLLDDEQSKLANRMIDEINLKHYIDNFQKSSVKYKLRELLINCGKEEILGLIYNLYIEMKNNNNNINEEEIKEKLYNKISNILPQDIICILPDNHIIRKLYYEKEYYNFKQYITDKSYKKYKITIIYTFSSLANTIDGSNNEMEFMVSGIRNENQLKITIEELKSKNDNNRVERDCKILIHFEQINSNKIQFISNFIYRHFKDDNYNYIFIIHIKRNFHSENNERIYSIPDINPDIKQLFIDNLNGNQIKLKHLLEKNIQSIMDDNDELMNLDREFKRSLTSFVYKELNEKNRNKNNFNHKTSLLNEDNYSEEILKYMDKDKDFKQKIIKKAKALIQNDKEDEGNCRSLIDKVFNNIGKNSLDIISCLLDYIKEQIFNKYLTHIFKVLESNNFLTTLVEIEKDSSNNNLDEKIISQLKEKFLDSINMDKNIYETKFAFDFKIPGLYNFYENLSNYISKNINVEYFNNEKKLRDYFSTNIEKEKKDFHNNEERLLSDVYDEINKDKFINDIIINIPTDLILKDYITYFLKKYIITNNTKLDINNKLINLLLNLRFSKEINEIIKNNLGNNIKIMLIKIMYIESNINYISNILKVFEYGKELFHDDGERLYNLFEEKIKDENKTIRYLTNENRNPEHTREVNECYYIFLANLCYIITSDKIKLTESLYFDNSKEDKIVFVEVNLYNEILKQINKILQNLNNDLILYLNEMYIIDELIEVIEFQKLKKIDIEKIHKIREYLRKSAEIIQNNQPEKINDLKGNLDDIYRELSIPKEVIIEEDKKYYDKYYDILRYIFFKEINKVNDVNYRVKILEYLIKEKEIIKKSNNIFQILLKSFIKKKKDFKKTKKNLLEAKEQIIKVIENNLMDSQQDNYLALTETLLYFFEKNSFIYLKNVLYDEKEPLLLEKEPMEVLKDCYKFLQDLIDENKKDEIGKNNKYITKLFCLGYIKTFCYIFIKVFDDDKAKFNDAEKIIDTINKKKSTCKMIKLYIYKILYNRYQIDAFLNQKYKDKYKLGKYDGFRDFIKFNEEEQVKYGFETLDNNNYESVYKVLEKYKKDNFNNEIQKEDIDDNLHIDNFYIAASNLILLRLKSKDFETSEIYDNFYKNVCKPLFDEKKNSNLIEFLFNPKKYIEIKKEYEINSENIESILYGFRYSLNDLLSNEDDDDDNHDYIYSSLYNIGKSSYLSEKYYPGTDTKEEPYYELYSKIKNHFKEKPNEGCYVCMCKQGFYHSVASGFPGISEKNIKCPHCKKEIGIISKKNIKSKIVNRDNYFRIFKDEDEIDSLKNNKSKKEKLNEINYMTLKKFEEKYISPLYIKEKGLPQIDKNNFFKENKIIRNLSQISYRLLNYILYSHLFFASLLIGTNKFDKYKPKDMKWGKVLNESYIFLKNELSKKGIDSIEIFMNYIFKDLFTKLNEKECIDNYEGLIEFENELETLIQEKIDKSVEEIKKYNEIINKNSQDKDSSISLLKEKYENNNYKKVDYPYYEYFYYTDYLDEDYVMDKILSHKEENKYPLLNKYLKYKKEEKKNNDLYSLDNLYLFNTVLNLINEIYSHKISREYAEKHLLKDIEIYKNSDNAKLIDKFIKFYNSLKIVESQEKEFKLKIDKNALSDFVIDDNNKFGKTYKDIYKKFIKKQNEELENLLDKKIIEGIFNSNCKNRINIQQIKENEIFTFNISDKFSFIDVIFNSSYRKIIDNKNYRNYNDFEIDLNDIEENMTELLLKNKKLLNEDIIVEFSYNNEIFENEINDIITSFKYYYTIADISQDDKEIIYNFIKNNEGNIDKYKGIINDFMTLIQYLTIIKKEEKDDDISEKSLISDILKNIEESISSDFLKIFEEKKELTVNKAFDIFNYYLQLIFKDIKDEIEKYQIQDEKENENGKKNQLNKKAINQLDNYFKKENIVISKEDLENAIQIFISLVLFREKDKDLKIKSNRKNLIDYLKSPDLWNNNKYKDHRFNDCLNDLKLCNIQINQILWLYNYLVGDEEIDPFKEIEEYIKSKSNLAAPNPIDNENNNDNNNNDEKSGSDSSSHKSDSDSESESQKSRD